jgi:hypothetical protein
VPQTGLYCRFEKAKKNQVSGVVCLFNPGQASPSPLTVEADWMGEERDIFIAEKRARLRPDRGRLFWGAAVMAVPACSVIGVMRMAFAFAGCPWYLLAILYGARRTKRRSSF